MQTVHFRAGETILAQGDMGNAAYLLIEGSVEVIVGAGGKSKRVATLSQGEVFGEMSLIEPGPRSATVRTLTEVSCVQTTYDDFIATIGENPEQALEFLKTLVRRLRQTNAMIAALDPQKRGLFEVIADWQKSVSQGDANLTDEEIERKYALMPHLF